MKGHKIVAIAIYKATLYYALKVKVYKTNPHTLKELRNNIHRELSTFQGKNSRA
jgi:hypothetical protein